MHRILLAAVSAAALLLFAAPSFAAAIFVSNEKDNTITVLNGDTLEVVKTIKVARRPRGIVVCSFTTVKPSGSTTGLQPSTPKSGSLGCSRMLKRFLKRC